MTSIQFLQWFQLLFLLQINPLYCSGVHPYYAGLQMGVGADAITNQFFGLALQNFSTNVQQYGQQSRWKFRSVSSGRELMELLDVGVAGAFQNWAAHTSPLAQFAQDIAINKYNTYLLLQLVIEVSEENIVRPQLSEEAEYYVEQYGLAEFQNIYGRQYLGGRIYGGIFLGLITVSTQTSAEKQTMIEGLKFSGSGTALTPSISTEAKKILENRLVEITTAQIFGQQQPVISTFDEMIDQIKKFPDLAVEYPVPIYGIFNQYKKSIAYNWQGAGVANDYQNQDDVLFELSTQATNLKDRKSNLEYVRQYYDLFEEFQVGNQSDRMEFLDQKRVIQEEISQEINQITTENVKINRAATACVYNMERCSIPTLSYQPSFELPEQQYGDVVLKAEVIVEEMFLQAQKEINNSLSSAIESHENLNSQMQLKINNNNQNLEYVISNVTKNIEDMFSVNTAMIYYGDINNIPSGWQLCDGSNLNGITIPDLRGRFPLGEIRDEFDDENRVLDATPIGKIGGDFQKVLTENELPAHTHNMQNNGNHAHSFDDFYYAEANCGPEGNNVWGSGSKNDYDNRYCSVTHDTQSSGDHSHTVDSIGQSQPFNIVPPFVVVHFICKIS